MESPIYITFVPHGRSGNQLFQYFAMHILREKFGHVYIPVHEFDAKHQTDILHLDDNSYSQILHAPFIDCPIRLDGYFQKAELYNPHREQLIALVESQLRSSTPDKWMAGQNMGSIHTLLKGTHRYPQLSEEDVVLSLRLDDFIQLPNAPNSDIIPPWYYTELLEQMTFRTLYIVCDQIRHDWEHKYLQYFKKWNPVLLQHSLQHDIAFMRAAPRLIHSNSTLCWLSSFLATTPKFIRHIVKTSTYEQQDLGYIVNIPGEDANTQVVDVIPLTHEQVYSLNAEQWNARHIHPLSYCIPSECILTYPTDKSQVVSSQIGGPSNYRFTAGMEDLYYKEYQKSRFAHTQKRGGWDCLRHYEIAANGCIPLFETLENCPISSMTTFPKQLISQAKRELLPWTGEESQIRSYNQYAEQLLYHMNAYCTAEAQAHAFLKTISVYSGTFPKRILLITGDTGVNYTRELLWIGLSRYLYSSDPNTLLATYPAPIPYLYNDFPDDQLHTLYGNGFTYSKRIPSHYRAELSTDEIETKIKENAWDLIIYGKVGPDEGQCSGPPQTYPLWDLVQEHYSKHQIVFLYGGDACQDLTTLNVYHDHVLRASQYGHCFVRELKC